LVASDEGTVWTIKTDKPEAKRGTNHEQGAQQTHTYDSSALDSTNVTKLLLVFTEPGLHLGVQGTHKKGMITEKDK
jgi:hypothetical protein